MLQGLTGWHLVIVLAVILLLFGSAKLPALARSLGQSAREFKGEMKAMRADDEADAAGTTAEAAATQRPSDAAAALHRSDAAAAPTTGAASAVAPTAAGAPAPALDR